MQLERSNLVEKYSEIELDNDYLDGYATCEVMEQTQQRIRMPNEKIITGVKVSSEKVIRESRSRNEFSKCNKQTCSDTVVDLKMRYSHLQKCSEHYLDRFGESVSLSQKPDNVCLSSDGHKVEGQPSATICLENEENRVADDVVLDDAMSESDEYSTFMAQESI